MFLSKWLATDFTMEPWHCFVLYPIWCHVIGRVWGQEIRLARASGVNAWARRAEPTMVVMVGSSAAAVAGVRVVAYKIVFVGWSVCWSVILAHTRACKAVTRVWIPAGSCNFHRQVMLFSACALQTAVTRVAFRTHRRSRPYSPSYSPIRPYSPIFYTSHCV